MISRAELGLEIARAFMAHRSEIATGTGWRPMTAAEIAADVALDLIAQDRRTHPPQPASPARVISAPAPAPNATDLAGATATIPEALRSIVTPLEVATAARHAQMLRDVRDWFEILIEPPARDDWLDAWFRDVNTARAAAAGPLGRFVQARSLTNLTFAELDELRAHLLELAEGATA